MALPKYEIKVLVLTGDAATDEAKLRSMGAQGWALVSVTVRTADYTPVAYLQREAK